MNSKSGDNVDKQFQILEIFQINVLFIHIMIPCYTLLCIVFFAGIILRSCRAQVAYPMYIVISKH
jgi:hypothetical protein